MNKYNLEKENLDFFGMQIFRFSSLDGSIGQNKNCSIQLLYKKSPKI